ncbi:MAG: hypothetical protein KatS3mg081_1342 [Gemmatimonadales bacterium]|nr:hypothetical protein HRbin33_00590 [bacterium HR33]GIW51987.1 MAG: hypothetical protein KatS3mg081_1342 [Gemmatimonadales bacterium]
MTKFERWSVWSTSGATIVSGAVYLWMKYFMTSADPYAVINHPLQPLVLKIHILVSPLLVFALGLIALKHVAEHLRRKVRAGRRSGLLLAGSAVPMVVSGYLIQVLTDQTWLKIAALTHIVTGTLFALGAAAHWAAVLRRKNGSNGRALNRPPGDRNRLPQEYARK